MADAVSKKKKKGNRRRKKMLRRLLKAVLIFLILLVLFLAGILIFRVKEVTVTGNIYCTQEEVEDWLAEKTGSTNSMYLAIRFHDYQPDDLPPVSHLKITLLSPQKIRITVTETTLVGSISCNGQWLSFDEQGVIRKITDEPVDGVKAITGIEWKDSDPKIGDKIPAEDDQIFTEIKQLAKGMKEYELNPDEIRVNGLDIALKFGNVTVYIGSESYSLRLAQIPPILQKLQDTYGGQAGVLHLEEYDELDTTVRFVPNEEPSW